MATPAATLAVLRASRPRCRHAADVLAFAVHAATTAAGFRLVAAGPRANDPSAAPAPADPSADPLDGWDAWEDAHAFRYVPETTTPRSREDGRDDVREVTVTSMTAGDACVVSVGVVRAARGGSGGSGRPERETASLTVPLAQHVDASLASTDPAGALHDVGALVDAAETRLFARLALGARRGDDDDEQKTNKDDARAGDVSRAARNGWTLHEERSRSTADRCFEGPRPPPGARFDPYGPPDVPEFAPGRFGSERDPTRGFPENPDAAFGGVPDGFHPPWPGGPVPGGPGFPPGPGGRGFPPPGWPPARGRGRGPPDLGPPPRGGGGFF